MRIVFCLVAGLLPAWAMVLGDVVFVGEGSFRIRQVGALKCVKPTPSQVIII